MEEVEVVASWEDIIICLFDSYVVLGDQITGAIDSECRASRRYGGIVNTPDSIRRVIIVCREGEEGHAESGMAYCYSLELARRKWVEVSVRCDDGAIAQKRVGRCGGWSHKEVEGDDVRVKLVIDVEWLSLYNLNLTLWLSTWRTSEASCHYQSLRFRGTAPHGSEERMKLLADTVAEGNWGLKRLLEETLRPWDHWIVEMYTVTGAFHP
jgi:hypothetical protein